MSEIARPVSPPRLMMFEDLAAVADQAARSIVAAADAAIAARGVFSLVLAGGSTPRSLYSLLAAAPYVSRVQWDRVEIYFGDERAVPPDHAESNFRMVQEALLGRVPLPAESIHRMRGEIEPQDAAREYGKILKARFGVMASACGPDVVLLGMGDDGHTASLFPHTPALGELQHRCVAHFVEKSTTGPSWRITVTAPFINTARRVLVMVCGASKAARLKEVLEGPRDPQRLPIQLINPGGGEMTWLVDRAAGAVSVQR